VRVKGSSASEPDRAATELIANLVRCAADGDAGRAAESDLRSPDHTATLPTSAVKYQRAGQESWLIGVSCRRSCH